MWRTHTLQHTCADSCVYIYRRDSDFIIAMTHVDDIGFASTSLSLMDDVREIWVEYMIFLSSLICLITLE